MKLHGLMAKSWEPVFLQIDLKDATLRIKDGTTPTPNSIEVKIGEGNLTYNESRNMEYTLDRGRLDEVREGDEVPIDVTLDFVWDFLKSSSLTGAIATIEDFFKKQGPAAAFVSTDADTCRPFAVDIEIDHRPDCPTQDKEIITLPDFRYETLAHDLRAGTVAVTGRCNATVASIVRSAQT